MSQAAHTRTEISAFPIKVIHCLMLLTFGVEAKKRVEEGWGRTVVRVAE
ncbi:hypothetical protein COLO4_09969 [Corchorus olitorius]|uniref:Uncharacterized protein n=1 Tax=Corchorus olitorius TaxID=93759 RepID=A0A1R3KAJ4_9ROSI|nr:hypothetical protein COLO4_09969 [Corchorus olitorius]